MPLKAHGTSPCCRGWDDEVSSQVWVVGLVTDTSDRPGFGQGASVLSFFVARETNSMSAIQEMLYGPSVPC